MLSTNILWPHTRLRRSTLWNQESEIYPERGEFSKYPLIFEIQFWILANFEFYYLGCKIVQVLIKIITKPVAPSATSDDDEDPIKGLIWFAFPFPFPIILFSFLFRVRDSHIFLRKYIRLRPDLNSGDRLGTCTRHCRRGQQRQAPALLLTLLRFPRIRFGWQPRPLRAAPAAKRSRQLSSCSSRPTSQLIRRLLIRTRDKMATNNIPSVQLDAALVLGASIQLPTFDRTEPDAWFSLADANFGLRKITDPQT